MAFPIISINSKWKATVSKIKSFNINRHIVKNTADKAEVFLDFAFFWQKWPDLSELKYSSNVLTKCPKYLRVISMETWFVADHLLPECLPMTNTAERRELSSKQLQSQGILFPGSPWSVFCFWNSVWKTILYSWPRWESYPGPSHPHHSFLIFELSTEHIGQRHLPGLYRPIYMANSSQSWLVQKILIPSMTSKLWTHMRNWA